MRERARIGRAALVVLLAGQLLRPRGPAGAALLRLSPRADARHHLGSLSARRRQLPRHATVRRAAPWDFLQGSLVDPNYWKQQYFLAGKFKTLLPNKKLLVALELCPGDSKYLGYLSPDKDSGSRLDNYIALGSLERDVRDTLKKQAEVFRTGIELREWEPGRRAEGRTESVDVALLAPGFASRLSLEGVAAGLREVQRLLASDGRVLIVAGKEDEEALGGSFETVLEAQDLADLPELDDIGLDAGEGPAGQLLRDAGLRLIRVVRDECGLTIGLCVKRLKEKTLAVPRAQRRAQAAASTRRSRPPARPPPRSPSPTRRGRAARRALPASQPAAS